MTLPAVPIGGRLATGVLAIGTRSAVSPSFPTPSLPPIAVLPIPSRPPMQIRRINTDADADADADADTDAGTGAGTGTGTGAAPDGLELEVAVLEDFGDAVEEAIGVHSVDDAMVVGERHVHDRTNRHQVFALVLDDDHALLDGA